MVRQAQHERNQYVTVHPELVEGFNQRFPNGAIDIVVLPYFLSAGRLVLTDIPEQIRQVSVEAPSIKINIAPYLGASEKIDDLLIHQAFSAYH